MFSTLRKALQSLRPTRGGALPAGRKEQNMTDENLKPAPDAGAPTKKMDEATATLLVALFCMAQRPYVSPQRQVFDFNAGLRHPGVTRNVVDGTETTQASIVQQIVAAAQTAGIVEGDVSSRLTVRTGALKGGAPRATSPRVPSARTTIK